MNMDKGEITKHFNDITDKVILLGTEFAISESEVVLTASSGFDENKLSKIVEKIGKITQKKVYLKFKKTESQKQITDVVEGKIISDELQLSENYRFSNLIAGEFNKETIYLSKHMKKWSSSVMTVWGGTGLGKTHLLHSVGWSTIEKGAYIWFTDSNRFIDSILKASKEKRILDLHQKWSTANIILFDDVQILSKLISKLPGIESELFNLIQLVENNNMRMIFVSDRNPIKLDFDDRINYRLSVNCHEITKPTFEDRRRILDLLLSARNLEIDELYLDKLASQLTQNVRQLTGAVNSIDIRIQLESAVSMDVIDGIIASLASPTDMGASHFLDRLVSVATTYLGVEKTVLLKKKGRDRNRIISIATARLLYPNLSVEKIAKFFNCSRKAVYEIAKREKESEDVIKFMNLVKSNRG